MNFIDKIFYINLDRRVDRKENFLKEMSSRGVPEDLIERFDAIENGDPLQSCMLSHISVLKIARQRKLRNVLIFEDDFEFLISQEDFHSKVKAFFDLGIPYDVLFLSYNVHRSEKYNDLVSYARECQTASGYLVNGLFLDTLIENFDINFLKLKQTGMHWLYINDQCWKSLQKDGNWFHFNDRIGRQKSGYSDLGKCMCEHNR